MAREMSSTFSFASTFRLYLSESSVVIRTASFLSTFSAVPGSAPRIRFSATVMDGTCIKCWCTMPSPAAIASLDEEKCTSFPSTKIWPSVGASIPNSIFIKVDFPAPFSPTSAWISPFLICRLTLWFATTPPGYTFVIFRASKMISCSIHSPPGKALIRLYVPAVVPTVMHDDKKQHLLRSADRESAGRSAPG